MKKRFVLSLLICIIMLTVLVVGCGQQEPVPAAPVQPAEPSQPVQPAGPDLEAAAEFYRGSNVTLAAGPAGSGVDVVARLFAKYFEEETGSRVVVENYSEIGGLQSMNVTYQANADGLTFGVHMGDTTIQNWLLGEDAALYELDEMGYIGSSSLAPMAIWVHPDGPYNTLEKFMAGSNIKQAGASRLGYMSFWGTLAGHIMELDFETIIGVGGPPAAKMSVLQQETDFTNIAIHTGGIAPDLIPLVLITDERHALMPDVPALTEVADLTAEQEEMLALSKTTVAFGPFFVTPPGVPEERLAYLQKIFEEITAREDFVADAIELLGVWGAINARDMEEGINFLIDRKSEFEELRILIEGYYS